MKNNGTVRGEKEHAVPLAIEKDTVYVRSNFRTYARLDKDGNETDPGYEYEEIQYDKDEYIKLISQKNN